MFSFAFAKTSASKTRVAASALAAVTIGALLALGFSAPSFAVVSHAATLSVTVDDSTGAPLEDAGLQLFSYDGSDWSPDTYSSTGDDDNGTPGVATFAGLTGGTKYAVYVDPTSTSDQTDAGGYLIGQTGTATQPDFNGPDEGGTTTTGTFFTAATGLNTRTAHLGAGAEISGSAFTSSDESTPLPLDAAIAFRQTVQIDGTTSWEQWTYDGNIDPDNSNFYDFTGLPAGQWAIEADQSTDSTLTKFAFNGGATNLDSAVPITVAPTLESQTTNVDFGTGTVVSGTISFSNDETDGSNDYSSDTQSDAYTTLFPVDSSGDQIQGDEVYSIGADAGTGSYSLTVAPGRYLQEFTPSGQAANDSYIDQWWNNSADQDDSDIIIVGSTPVTHDQTLGNALTIAGHVTSDGNAQSVTGLVVTAQDEYSDAPTHTTVQPDGSYSMPVPAQAPYTLEFSDPTGTLPTVYYDGTTYGTTSETEAEDLVQAHGTETADMSFKPVSSLTVSVTNKAGTALGSVDVTAVPVVDGVQQSDGYVDATPVHGHAGSYLLSALTAGTSYALFFYPTGSSLTGTYPQYLGGSDLLQQAQLFTPAIGASTLAVTLASNSSVTGVADTTAGKPIKGVHVILWEHDGTTWEYAGDALTSSSGAYSYANVPTGSYTVEFDSTGSPASPADTYISSYAGGASTLETSTPVYVAPGRPAVLSAKLTLGGSLTGVVAGGTSANTLSGVYVTPVALTGSIAGGFTAATANYDAIAESATGGKFSITGLATGYYALSFDYEGPTSPEMYRNPYVNPVTNPLYDHSKVYLVTAGKATAIAGAAVLPTSISTDTATLNGHLDESQVGGIGTADGYIGFTDANGDFVDSTQFNDDGTFSINLPPGQYTYSLGVVDDDSDASFEDLTGTVQLSAGSNPDLIPVVEPLVALGFSDPSDLAVTGANTAVGSSYAVTGAISDREGVTPTYQWFRGTHPIYGATNGTYTSLGGDLGQPLTVRVSLSDYTYGLENVSMTLTAANPVTVGAQITATQDPSIVESANDAKVGVALHANPGVWSVPGASYVYAWMVNGVVVGTKSSYIPTVTDAGASITVTVTASKAGYGTSDPVTSDPLLVDFVSAPTLKTAPKVTSKTVGGVVTYTVTPGTWSIAGTTPSYEWVKANGDALPSTTNSFAFTTAPGGVTDPSGISVIVTASKTGYASGSTTVLARKSSATLGDNGADVQLRDSAISGTIGENDTTPIPVGSTLSVPNLGITYSDDGTAPTTYTYQWGRSNGATVTIIKGATKPTYVVSTADLGGSPFVSITASSPTHNAAVWGAGAGSGTVQLDQSLVTSPAAINETATSTDDPGTKVGATVGAWGAVTGVTNSYQWSICLNGTDCSDPANFSAIQGATAATYTPAATASDVVLLLTVTGKKTGYANGTATLTVDLNSSGTISVVTPPVISGNVTFGGKATAKAATFDATGVTAQYKWVVVTNGTAVDGHGVQGGLTYTPVAADFTAGASSQLEVQVVGTKGLSSTPTFSDGAVTSAVVQLIKVVPVPTKKPIVTYNSSTQQWTVVPGTWPTAGGTGGQESYTWFLDHNGNGDGANGTYPTDSTSTVIGPQSSVNLVVTYSGAAAYLDTHVLIQVQKGTAPSPQQSASLTGSAVVGGTLQAPTNAGDVFDYPSVNTSAFLSYQWYSGISAISKATNSSFPVTSAYVGKALSVKITSTSQDYATAVTTLQGGLVTAAAAQHGTLVFSNTGGTLHPGVTASVALDPTMISGMTHAYQWQASSDDVNWTNIAGATKSSYLVPTASLGTYLRIAVTNVKAGYATGTDYAGDHIIVQPSALAPITAPALVDGGTTGYKAGTVVTVDPGSWNVAGTTFTYKWFRNGGVIPGLTSSSYTLTGDNVQDVIQVEVTAHLAGFNAVSVNTNTITVDLGAAPVAITVPKVTGSMTAGSTVTATAGVWSLDGLVLSYQWFDTVTGSVISGATSSTYVIDPSLNGHAVYVTVTATRAGYAQGGASSVHAAPLVG